MPTTEQFSLHSAGAKLPYAAGKSLVVSLKANAVTIHPTLICSLTVARLLAGLVLTRYFMT